MGSTKKKVESFCDKSSNCNNFEYCHRNHFVVTNCIFKEFCETNFYKFDLDNQPYSKAFWDWLISQTDCKINKIIDHIVFYIAEKREDPFSLLIRYISMMGIRIMDLFRMFDTENGASVSKANFIRGLKVLINFNWFVITKIK